MNAWIYLFLALIVPHTCTSTACSKHRCPLHTGISSTAGRFDGSTTHREAYAPHDPQPRRGLAIPPVSISDIPLGMLDATTVHRLDYVAHPYSKRASCKKDGLNNHQPVSTASFSDVTSYSHDFPPRLLGEALRGPRDLRRKATVPFSVDFSRQSYTTTNEAMLPRWAGLCRTQAFGDPPSQLAFEGKFQGRSVASEDFNSDAVRDGRPSTTCKKSQDNAVKVYDKFDDSTTSKTAFAVARDSQMVRPALYLKGRSRKHAETMPPLERQEGLPSELINSGSGIAPEGVQPQGRRGLCPPQPDMLKLFDGIMETTSEHKRSYQTWRPELPIESKRPRAATKSFSPFANEDHKKPFEAKTSNMQAYVPIHPSIVSHARKEVNALAESNSCFDRGGRQVKEAQDFGVPFQGSTVNNSDYFRFWGVSPRYRYGDRYETVQETGNTLMEVNSEMKLSFVPHKGVKPAESFKPELPQAASSSEMSHVTEYNKEFTAKPIAIDTCPVVLLLQNVHV